MSEWYHAIDDDIDIEEKDKAVNILVHQNYQGNVYVTLTFNQIRSLFNKIEAIENAQKTEAH